MKRCLAFALIAAIGIFVIGCGENKAPPPGYKPPEPGKGFGTSVDKNKTPAAPGATNKKP